jgi:hypothetical protein
MVTAMAAVEFSALREALGIHALERELVAIRERLDQLEPACRPAWYNLKRACELKGVAYNTVKSRRELQPNGGNPDGKVGGRRLWLRATIERWSLEADLDERCPSDRKVRDDRPA